MMPIPICLFIRDPTVTDRTFPSSQHRVNIPSGTGLMKKQRAAMVTKEILFPYRRRPKTVLLWE
jgi:hypothetical protein